MRWSLLLLRIAGFALFAAAVAVVPSFISDFRSSELALVGISSSRFWA